MAGDLRIPCQKPHGRAGMGTSQVPRADFAAPAASCYAGMLVWSQQCAELDTEG